MNDPKKTPTAKNTSVFGPILLMAGTAIATYLATKNSDKIVAGAKVLAQHVADGSMVFPPAGKMNGADRTKAAGAN